MSARLNGMMVVAAASLAWCSGAVGQNVSSTLSESDQVDFRQVVEERAQAAQAEQPAVAEPPGAALDDIKARLERELRAQREAKTHAAKQSEAAAVKAQAAREAAARREIERYKQRLEQELKARQAAEAVAAKAAEQSVAPPPDYSQEFKKVEADVMKRLRAELKKASAERAREAKKATAEMDKRLASLAKEQKALQAALKAVPKQGDVKRSDIEKMAASLDELQGQLKSVNADRTKLEKRLRDAETSSAAAQKKAVEALDQQLNERFRKLEAEWGARQEAWIAEAAPDVSSVQDSMLDLVEQFGVRLRAQRKADEEARAQAIDEDRAALLRTAEEIKSDLAKEFDEKGRLTEQVLRQSQQLAREESQKALKGVAAREQKRTESLRKELLAEVNQLEAKQKSAREKEMAARDKEVRKLRDALDQHRVELAAYQSDAEAALAKQVQAVADVEDRVRAGQAKVTAAVKAELSGLVQQSVTEQTDALAGVVTDQIKELKRFNTELMAQAQKDLLATVTEQLTRQGAEADQALQAAREQFVKEAKTHAAKVAREAVAEEQKQLAAFQEDMVREMADQREAQLKAQAEMAATTGAALGEFKSRLAEEMKLSQQEVVENKVAALSADLESFKADLESEVTKATEEQTEKMARALRDQSAALARQREALDQSAADAIKAGLGEVEAENASSRKALQRFIKELSAKIQAQYEAEAAARAGEVLAAKQQLQAIQEQLEGELDGVRQARQKAADAVQAADAKARAVAKEKQQLDGFKKKLQSELDSWFDAEAKAREKKAAEADASLREFQKRRDALLRSPAPPEPAAAEPASSSGPAPASTPASGTAGPKNLLSILKGNDLPKAEVVWPGDQ